MECLPQSRQKIGSYAAPRNENLRRTWMYDEGLSGISNNVDDNFMAYFTGHPLVAQQHQS